MLGYRATGNSLHSEPYRPDIDGIRAVAVTAVIVSHAFPRLLPGGFIGVDVFFVISGYLISSILIRDLRSNSFSILHFYRRRINRIFPALILVLLFILLFGWFCLFRPEFAALGGHVSLSSLFSENFLLWNQAGYFDAASETKPTLHLWSLAIEEQFYIFWPMMLFLVHRWRINIALVCALFAAASFVLNLHEVRTSSAAAFYSPLGRSWELMLGSLLACLRVDRAGPLQRYKSVQSFAGLALIVVALTMVTPQTRFPGWWALVPTAGTFLLISGGEGGWVNRCWLAKAPLVWVGLLSYPLYLWHWPLLSFCHIVLGSLNWKRAAACLIAAAMAAAVTFFVVERPFRRPGSRLAGTWWLVSAMLATLLCSLLVARGAIAPRLRRFDAPTSTEWDFLRERTANFDRDGVGVYALESNRSNQVLMIGDSHIAQYAARLARLMKAEPQLPGAILAIGGGCIPIEGVTSAALVQAKCWPLRAQAYRMAEDSRFSTIVIGAAWNWYFLTDYYACEVAGLHLSLGTPQGRAVAMQQLAQRMRLLIKSGKKVVLILDNPMSEGFNPGLRAIRLSLSAKDFDPEKTIEIDARQLELREQMLRLAHDVGASVIDPYSAVCTGNICRVTDASRRPIYKDLSHFNPDWVLDRATFIDSALSR
jgi:peptidoglycan/LPS O-acetylase OafA/YrhL